MIIYVLINEEDNNHQDNNEFIENILSENTFLFKESLINCVNVIYVPKSLFFSIFLLLLLYF